MTRAMGICFSVLSVLAAAPALAQEQSPGPATVEVTIVPGGATFFTAKGKGPEFGNYTYGGALTYNITRFVGVEGEVAGTAGIAERAESRRWPSATSNCPVSPTGLPTTATWLCRR